MFEITQASALGTVLAYFWPALLTEVAVIAVVARAAWRGGRGWRWGTDTSGLWSLPLLVWAFQANVLLLGLLQSDPAGLALVPRTYERFLVTAFVSLFYRLQLQTVATILTRDAPATLGMTGRARTAATVAMLSVFLDVGLVLWYLTTVAPYGLPLRFS